MRRQGDAGYTFIEIVIVSAIIAILATAILPLTRVAMQRQREIELRRTLRELRTAIDHYKDAADQGMLAATELKLGNEGYPPTLQVLVDGVRASGDATDRKLKFLRRIPIDPITKSKEWGMRSYQDAQDARSWGGQNVYDVFTTSDGTALDGTKYKDW